MKAPFYSNPVRAGGHMLEIEVNGQVYIFEDDWKVIEWLDANADNVREVSYGSN